MVIGILLFQRQIFWKWLNELIKLLSLLGNYLKRKNNYNVIGFAHIIVFITNK
jgi:hypothetical protein